jgi:hypothetical protein
MKMTVTEIGPDHRPTTVVMEATSTQDVETLSTLALAAASGQPLEFGAVDGAELDVDPGAGDRLAPEATAANVEFCARVAHEANRSWSALHGDPSHVAWEAAPDWQRDSARSGVRFLFDRNLEVGVDGLHREWMRSKLEDGWTFGEVKDPVAKTHPCLRPFTELPSEQQAKDMLFMATVASCAMTLRAHERELAMAEEPTAEEDTAAIASAMRQAAAALGLDGDVVLVGADGSVLADLSADAEAPTDPAPAPERRGSRALRGRAPLPLRRHPRRRRRAQRRLRARRPLRGALPHARLDPPADARGRGAQRGRPGGRQGVPPAGARGGGARDHGPHPARPRGDAAGAPWREGEPLRPAPAEG